MTYSKNFKQALIEGKLDEALAIAISQAPELKITTSIVSSSSHNVADNDSKPKNPPPTKRLHTRINLVEGEIHNEISEDLIGNADSQEVQQFHFEQVARGHQIIQKNLESLQNIFRLMTTIQPQQLAGNYQNNIKYLEPDSSKLASKSQASPPEEENVQANTQSNLLATTNGVDNPPSIVLNKPSEQNSDMVNNSKSIAQEQKDEDWGEWLEDEEQGVDVDLLDLSSLELDESEEWEEWEEEETQLFTGAPTNSSAEKNQPIKE